MAIEHLTIDFSAIDIRPLLPQQPPFVMVGNILSCDATTTRCSYTVPPDNIFFVFGLFTAPGLIEHVAQTAAARLGFINLYVNKADAVQVGYIGAIKDFEIVRLPRVGETIETEILIEQEVMGMTLVSARVMIGNELIATTSMKIALAPAGTEPKV